MRPDGGEVDFSIPGDPGAVHAYAGRLQTGSSAMATSGDWVQQVDTGRWTGSASAGFSTQRSALVERFHEGSAVIAKAAAAIDDYADALQAAQRRAAAAASSYDSAVASTNSAADAFNTQVAAYNASGAGASSGVADPGIFQDPGAAGRSAALAELADARAAVEEAGARAAAAVRPATLAAPLRPTLGPPASFDTNAAREAASARPGGIASDLPTDPAALKALLDLARSMGMNPRDYSALLQQYYTCLAAQHAGIDLAAWDPTAGAAANKGIIEQVYRYYGQLFLQHPELQWAGMANLIGPSFAGGFFDLDAIRSAAKTVADRINQLPDSVISQLPPELKALAALPATLTASELHFYETTLLSMQKEIFLDQGMLHEAYLSGGTGATDELAAAGMIDSKTAKAGHAIASGDPGQVDTGSAALLDREQNVIVPDEYDEMRTHPVTGEAFTYLLTTVGAPSIPGAHTAAEYSPLSFGGSVTVPSPVADATTSAHVETPLPDFNISYRLARWDMIRSDTLPAYQDLVHNHPEQLRELVGSDLGQRIDAARLSAQWDDIVRRLATEWDVDASVDVDLHRPHWP